MTYQANQSEDVSLKPCAFCGGPAIWRGAGGWCGIGCHTDKCPAYLHALMFRTSAEAEAAWNRRALPPQAKAEPAGVSDAMVEAGAVVLAGSLDCPRNADWGRRWARKVLEAAILSAAPSTVVTPTDRREEALRLAGAAGLLPDPDIGGVALPGTPAACEPGEYDRRRMELLRVLGPAGAAAQADAEMRAAASGVSPACGVHGPIPCAGAGCTCAAGVSAFAPGFALRWNDRFMEVLSAIHGPVDPGVNDSARLAFAQTLSELMRGASGVAPTAIHHPGTSCRKQNASGQCGCPTGQCARADGVKEDS